MVAKRVGSGGGGGGAAAAAVTVSRCRTRWWWWLLIAMVVEKEKRASPLPQSARLPTDYQPTETGFRFFSPTFCFTCPAASLPSPPSSSLRVFLIFLPTSCFSLVLSLLFYPLLRDAISSSLAARVIARAERWKVRCLSLSISLIVSYRQQPRYRSHFGGGGRG